MGELAEGECVELRDDAWNYCGELVCEHQDRQNDVLPGYAALQVLRIALWDNMYPEVVEEGTTDEDVDPEDNDYAFCAAASWAGGTIWNESSSSSQRQAFWRWWLTEAVPAAWHTKFAN